MCSSDNTAAMVANENQQAAIITREEVRMLFGQWQERGHNRRLHQKQYDHADRRVGRADRRVGV